MVCTLSFGEISNIHDGLHIRLASALLTNYCEVLCTLPQSFTGGGIVNHISYADGMCLLSLYSSGMQKLLNILYVINMAKIMT